MSPSHGTERPAPPAFLVQRLGVGEEGEILRARALFDEPPDPQAARTYLQDERNVFFLAYHRAVPVGFLRGSALGQISTERRQMFLYEIAVGEAYRRRGIGRALVEALLRFCREGRFAEVFVFTDDPGNRAAEELYRATGGVTETVGDRMFVYRL
ncbi:MAG: GNAT family N-acetyltransferase [Thermoplasmata archaeon]|nr:GNAT family N-acetyltransferase [Thermoplasmata archaeon]